MKATELKAVEDYLHALHLSHASGGAVTETSHYPALANLLNEIGKALKPRVRCVLTPQDLGAGRPDFGLFTPDQFARAGAEPRTGQYPSRGAVEVKGPGDDAPAVASGEQVGRYLGTYRQVLVTNYRDFVLVGIDAHGQSCTLERHCLAESEPALWGLAAHPQATARRHGPQLVEYLKRALLRPAPLAEPEALAWYLASYAREARARVESRHDLPALAAVREALEEALGLQFQDEKGEHFFRSTLVQTLFYGVFSAWVLWDREHPRTDRTARFEWREAHWHLHVPMIRGLFQQLASPQQLGPLGLVEVLDWAGQTLQRVDRASFFERFDAGQAVQYFYEPFLQAFDPELRKELGVWYTPPEIVRYMVERVDRVLRSELGIADGLADPSVYVLDPCCGTGAYLVEVLKRIRQTLEEKGGDALSGQDLKQAAMDRVFGFELLPAPFVIAHLQLGLLLQSLGAPLSEEGGERVGVSLTNALTGWEPPQGPKQRLPFLELEQERDAAEKVKQEVPILVILGNPPYNGFAGVSPEEEGGLVECYKEGLLSEWGIRKYNLDELYVRFFRLAERRVAEKTGRGVICYISSFSYVSDPSFVVMRKRLLSEFDLLWVDCLNGDSRETGKLTPEGRPDPSVFSTPERREGIRVGTAIALMVRSEGEQTECLVRFRDLWGTTKRADLLSGLHTADPNLPYGIARPTASERFSFRCHSASTSYPAWPRLVDLCQEDPISGLAEKRKGALLAISRDALAERMSAYLDPTVSWEALQALVPGLTHDAGRFPARAAREKVLRREPYSADRIVRYALYPFDRRWCYYTDTRPIWNEPRPALVRQSWPGNRFLVTRMMAERPGERVPVFVTSALPDHHLLRPNVVAIPFLLGAAGAPHRNGDQASLLGEDSGHRANLSRATRAHLTSLGVADVDADAQVAGLIWMHALAIGYAPGYLSENGDAVRRDWPRLPLPDTPAALFASAGLGEQVAALLDTDEGVPGVTTGGIRRELRVIGTASREGGGVLQPADLAVGAGWGHVGQGGVTMPGAGKWIGRPYSSEETAAIAAGAEALGLASEEALVRLGETTRDIYLNGVAYWRNVPEKVWGYTIGGYQVMKKWLSYRESDLLGRALTPDEVREVTNMARRIAALLLLEPALDENYARAKAAAYAWPAEGSAESGPR